MMKTKFQMRYVTGMGGVQKSVTMRDIGMGGVKSSTFLRYVLFERPLMEYFRFRKVNKQII